MGQATRPPCAWKHHCHLIEVAPGNHNKDHHQDRRAQDRTEDSLNEDGVLDLAKGGFLDPDLTVEDLADDVALVVLGDPGFVLVASVGPEGVH